MIVGMKFLTFYISFYQVKSLFYGILVSFFFHAWITFLHDIEEGNTLSENSIYVTKS